MTSCIITGYLIAALRGTAEFRSGDHALLMVGGRDEIQRWHAEEADKALGEAQATTFTEDPFRMGRITWTGVWLSVLPYTVNGTELGTQEWMDYLFLLYFINPPELPEHCDGFGAAFDIFHALK